MSVNELRWVNTLGQLYGRLQIGVRTGILESPPSFSGYVPVEILCSIRFSVDCEILIGQNGMKRRRGQQFAIKISQQQGENIK